MSQGQIRSRCTRLFGLLTVSVILSACAVQTQRATLIPALENQPLVEIEPVDLLAVSASMQRFIRNYAPEDMARGRKAWNLAYAALDPILLNFDYDPSLTLTAADTFKQRTGNCLSFSNMFVALAREAGLNAWFQEVKLPPEWSNINETILVSMHVNAVVQDGQSEYVVDVSGAKRAEWTRIRKLSDAEAAAQYYNNLGADALVKNDLPRAFAYFEKAIGIAPDTSYIWSNLGVVYNRNGQREDAKKIYLTALEINPAEAVALNNLHAIYLKEGDLFRAEKISSRVEKHRRKNPYYLHHLSSQALDEQRYGDAIELLKRAIKLNDAEYRFHITLARSLYLNGEKNAALQSLAQAKLLAPPDRELDTISLTELEHLSDT
ncbi:MAG: tetratricopeptide repeat protein [Xanthomonadales bacterium]